MVTIGIWNIRLGKDVMEPSPNWEQENNPEVWFVLEHLCFISRQIVFYIS